MTTKEKLKKIWQFINRNFIGLPEKSSNNQESLNIKKIGRASCRERV